MSRVRRRLASVLLGSVFVASVGWAAEDPVLKSDVPMRSLASALEAFSYQTNLQLFYKSAVIWAGTQFLAIGYGPTPCCPAVFATSSDGLSWTITTSNTMGILYSAAYSGSDFLAVGGTMWSSPDAISWTSIATVSPLYLLGIAFSGSEFVAVGQEGSIYTSP